MLRQSVQQGGKNVAGGSKTVQETGRTIQETAQETGRTAQETAQESMMGVAERILDMVRKTPFITTSEMAKRLGMTRSGVNYHLATLKRDFGLHHEGPTKKGRWILPELR
jgi:ATP-dependent DNA helicase RecG